MPNINQFAFSNRRFDIKKELNYFAFKLKIKKRNLNGGFDTHKKSRGLSCSVLRTDNSMSQILSPFWADYLLLLRTHSAHEISLRCCSCLWKTWYQADIYNFSQEAPTLGIVYLTNTEVLKSTRFPTHNFRRNNCFLISLWTLTSLVLRWL